MNKKIIIGLVVAGVVIVGWVYLYNLNKKNAEIKKPVTDNKNLTTQSDATDFLDLFVKRGNKPYNPNQIKKYVELYTTNIDKDLHKRLMIALTKKESEFNTQDKLDITVLNEKVDNPTLKEFPKRIK